MGNPNYKVLFFHLMTIAFLVLVLPPISVMAQPFDAARIPDSSSYPTPPHMQLSEGYYLDIPSNDSLKLTVFTIGAWFNGNHSGSGNNFIMSKGATGEGEDQGENMNYGIYINRRSQAMGGFETAEGRNYILTSQSVVADDQWHHIALTYNGSVLSMFVDGKFEAANITRGALPDNSGNDPLRMGAKSSDSTTGVFTGLVDNVLVLNTPVDLPLNFSSVSQIPPTAKIIDLQSPPQPAANSTLIGAQFNNDTGANT